MQSATHFYELAKMQVTDLDKAIVKFTFNVIFFSCHSCKYLKIPHRDMKHTKLLGLQNIRFFKEGHLLSTTHWSVRFGTTTDWNKYNHIRCLLLSKQQLPPLAVLALAST
jgi:hypothetical protein